MKLRQLLLCGGLFAAMTASAAISVTERTAPVFAELPTLPAPAQAELLLDGTDQYLYNPGLQAYFSGGNNWNTRATGLVEKGHAVQIEVSGATYIIKNSASVGGTYKRMFAGGATDIWVDNDTGANSDKWSFTVAADGSFTIANESAAAGGVFGGVVPDFGTMGEQNTSIIGTYLNLYPAETANFHSKWYAVSTAEYETNIAARADLIADYTTKRDAAIPVYKAELAVYNASVALLEALNKADAAGVAALDEYVGVYNNAAATVEDLEKATTAVNDLIANVAFANASAENPADITTKLSAPDMSSNSGWSYGEGSVATVALGNGIGELYGGWDTTQPYDAYQALEGLKPGVYAFGAQGFHRTDYYETKFVEGNTEGFAVLYSIDTEAKDTLESPLHNILFGIQPNNKLGAGREVSVKVGAEEFFLPDDLASAAEYFNQGYYQNNQVFFNLTGEKAVVGIKNMNKIMRNWTCFDNLTLKYYGAGADAYQLWFKELLKNATVYSEDAQITTSVLEGYNTAITAAQAAAPASYDEVKAELKKIADAEALVKANIEAWKAYIEAYTAAETTCNSGIYNGDAMEALYDYISDNETVVEDKELTTEELLAEAEKLKQMTSDAIQSSILPGTVYDQLKNTDFSEGDAHWTWESNNDGAGSDGSAFISDAGAKCAEAWSVKSFDLYQTIENAPVGMYTISVQGFGRVARGDKAWQGYFNNDGSKKDEFTQLDAWVYMNDNKTQLPSVFEYPTAYTLGDDGTANHRYALAGEPSSDQVYQDPNVVADVSESGYVYPDGMASAGVAFAAGDYTFSTFGLVAKKGDVLRVGMKGSSEHSTDADSWAIFTNFQLVFQGTEAEYVGPALQQTLDKIDLTAPMGSEIIGKATELKNAGLAAYNATPQDGKVMFDALAAILHYQDTITSSVKLFAELKAENDAFYEYMLSAPNQSIVEEASNLYAEIDKAITNGTYTNAQAEEAIKKIADMMVKLAYPADYEQATDGAPADFTSVLKSPSFEDEDGNNSREGWTLVKGSANFGNDDTQKSALAIEFYQNEFDMYQTVAVPNGTYLVSAKGFARNNGGAQRDYELWLGDTLSVSKLYAVSGTDTVSVSLDHQATTMNASIDSIGSASFYAADSTKFYVPNSMVEFKEFVMNDANVYNNSVIIKVTDEKLTIGFNSTVNTEWVILDDVTLFYYGTNSAKAEGGWTTDITNVAQGVPAKVEFFNLQGVKANSLMKGLNIVRTTDANGNVKIQKVIVK